MCIRDSNIAAQYLKTLIPCVYGKEFSEQEIEMGELHCKKYLLNVLEDLLSGMREKRKYYEKNKDYIEKLILCGTEKVSEISRESLNNLKRGLGYNGEHCIW